MDIAFPNIGTSYAQNTLAYSDSQSTQQQKSSKIHLVRRKDEKNPKNNNVSRRDLLKQAARLGICLPFAGSLGPLLSASPQQHLEPARPPVPTSLSQADDDLLEELEKANFLYFWEQANPQTGMVRDRCNVRTNDNNLVGSIAATGFGLTAICIGQKRGYISLSEARERVVNSLRFLWKKLPTHRGFFYHFASLTTGERLWDSEVSSVDTAILLCGILTCRQHFQHSEISLLAYEIFNRVDWTWLSEDTSLLPHGWTPEIGFLPYRWDYYSELMMMYLLGLGSVPYPAACRDLDCLEA